MIMLNLITAISRVTGNHDWAEDETPDAAEAVRAVRDELDHAEIDYWELDDAELAAAYHTVIDASAADIAAVLGNTSTE
jgi:hypothetical protein